MQSRTYAPPKDLGDRVEKLWTGTWDLPKLEPHTTKLLSDPCVNIVFERGGRHAGARLVGVWTPLWRRTLDGRGRVRAAKLKAGALRALLPVAALDVTNRIVPLADLFGAEVKLLEHAVLDPEEDAEGLAALEQWLRARRLPRDSSDSALAVNIMDRIVHGRGVATVRELASASGLCTRSLQRLFRAHVGASPKWAIRRHRLQEVALRIESGNVPNLASLAAELGYTPRARWSACDRGRWGTCCPGRRAEPPG